MKVLTSGKCPDRPGTLRHSFRGERCYFCHKAKCSLCGGFGWIPSTPATTGVGHGHQTCPRCEGKGAV